MKNRKGFTLMELLLVIAVLGIIGVIVTVSFAGTLSNTNQQQCDDFVQEVEDATCSYASFINKQVICNRDYCPPIELNILVQEGLVTSEKDACTNGEINLSETVTVSWDETGEKHCVYNGVREYAK